MSKLSEILQKKGIVFYQADRFSLDSYFIEKTDSVFDMKMRLRIEIQTASFANHEMSLITMWRIIYG
jgi:hypothetical protein